MNNDSSDSYSGDVAGTAFPIAVHVSLPIGALAVKNADAPSNSGMLNLTSPLKAAGTVSAYLILRKPFCRIASGDREIGSTASAVTDMAFHGDSSRQAMWGLGLNRMEGAAELCR